VRGNNRTIGMAGAMTGLADNYFGSIDNPAGTALTEPSIDLQIVNSQIEDQFLSNPQTYISSYALGVAIPFDTWGLSFGYSLPFRAISPAGEELSLKELRVTASKTLFESRLSLGIGIAPSLLEQNQGTFFQLRTTWGALYRFPKRVLLGLSFSPSSGFGPDPIGRRFSIPSQVGLGTSWIPNRSFRVAMSIRWIEAEQDLYLFHIPTQPMGTAGAYQAHLGFAYRFLSLKGVAARLFAGAYVENKRMTDPYRVHSTSGIEVLPWFLNIAAGLDIAQDYKNVMFSFGVDVGDLLRRFKILPRNVQAPPAGVFPNPIEINDDWLPTKIQDHPENAFQTIGPELQDFKNSINNLPENIQSPGPPLEKLYKDVRDGFQD